MKLGIDFGTTNTAVSRLEGDEPAPLRFGGAQEPDDYVPSVLALRAGARPREEHGRAALERVGEAGFAVYQNFKMLLGEPPAQVAAHWGKLPEAPEAITRRFIARLLEQIRTEHGLSATRAVVTVPEVWLAQNLQTKREHLIRAFKDQGIRRVEVHSEPVAAATYYLHRVKQHNHQPFEGHLLVCDCGGGTLDFCLLGVEYGAGGPRMTVLDRAGNGSVDGHMGSAGVAFDQAVVECLQPGLREQDPARFQRRVREFERHKITHTNDVSELLALHRSSPETAVGECLFQLADGKLSVEAEHLATVFDDLIAPDIGDALAALLARIAEHGVALADPARFRVLMVGGFSAFWLVQEAIKAAFGQILQADRRFEDLLTLADRALAISKGAALLASDLAEVIETCPADVGIRGCLTDGDGILVVRNFPVLHKAVKIADYRKTVWSEHIFQIIDTEIRLPVYVSVLPGKPLALDIGGETLRAVLPVGVDASSRVQIGFSIDEDLVFSIHVRDATNRVQEKLTTLGNVMAELPGLNVA
ncbi:Hsp70 family protein [Thiocapsa roseopersicina]|uniref:Molecular chaperone DnaK n=1 Tax=Thiocapsa roseopersicina TaxID=1058 RepID=A0A1H2Y9J9_THIRO|nr:Hsp70 family protein [Thiocapsa roseopersicina]SDX01498.1 molecular chaperone DnaK [Thiocapsa roseopersicina]